MACFGADAGAASRKEWEGCKQQDPDKSIAACNRILARKGKKPLDRAAALFNRGVAYADKRDDERAIEDFSESIKLDPKYARAYNSRGSALTRMGEFQRAVRDFDEAIRLDARYALAYNNRGEALEGLENLSRAMESYEKAVSLDPKLARPYINRGDIHLYSGNFEQAIADYTRGLAIRGRFAAGYQHRAIAYLYSGEDAKALADINQAVELEPKIPRNALWLEIISRRNQLESRLPDMLENLDMTRWPAPLVRLFLRQTTVAAAVAAADNQDASVKRSRLCDVSFFAGVVSAQKSDKDEAIRLLTAAAKQCPANSVFRSAADAELKLLGTSL